MKKVWSIVLTLMGAATAAIWLCQADLVAPPLHAVGTGVPRRFRVAPSKAGDDWESFVDQLDKFKDNLPNATFEVGDLLYSAEKCEMDTNCDIVTIDRKDVSYTFKIRNANRSHPVKLGCSSCPPGTPPGACDGVAQADFVQFVFQHNSCHEDSLTCRESSCP